MLSPNKGCRIISAPQAGSWSGSWPGRWSEVLGPHTLPGALTPQPLRVPAGWQGSIPDGRMEEHLRQDQAREGRWQTLPRLQILPQKGAFPPAGWRGGKSRGVCSTLAVPHGVSFRRTEGPALLFQTSQTLCFITASDARCLREPHWRVSESSKQRFPGFYWQALPEAGCSQLC